MPYPKPRLRPIRPPSVHAARLAVTLAPALQQLAGDTWLLAQKSPALPADPALLAQAGHLLAGLRSILRWEPDRHGLPHSIAPDLPLHALALLLRQLQAELAAWSARHAAPRARTFEAETDDILRLETLYLRHLVDRAVASREVALPPDLRPARQPRQPTEPGRPGKPPAPLPHITRAQTRLRNARRRAAQHPAPDPAQNPDLAPPETPRENQGPRAW